MFVSNTCTCFPFEISRLIVTPLVLQDRGSRLSADVLSAGGGAWSGEDEIDAVTLSVVMEMGYTEDQVRAAFDSLRARNPAHRPIQTEDVVDILLQQSEEVTPLSSDSAGQGQRKSVTLTENLDCSTGSLGSEIEKNHLTGNTLMHDIIT